MMYAIATVAVLGVAPHTLRFSYIAVIVLGFSLGMIMSAYYTGHDQGLSPAMPLTMMVVLRVAPCTHYVYVWVAARD
jgi:hypothetical protein